MYLEGEVFYFNYDEKEEIPLIKETYRIGYWRKYYELHHFIVDTFANGEDKCQQISLSLEDLKTIRDVIDIEALPKQDSMLWSEDAIQQLRSDSLAVFEKAIKWLEKTPIEDSRSVYYEASW